jgi:hypothetical protein
MSREDAWYALMTEILTLFDTCGGFGPQRLCVQWLQSCGQALARRPKSGQVYEGFGAHPGMDSALSRGMLAEVCV